MSNISHLPTMNGLEQMKGPDRYGCVVVVDGHEVPNMWLVDNGGPTVEVCFDGPVHHIVPREFAAQALEIAAKAMAVGAGYSHISSEHASTKPYGPKVTILAGLPKE